LGTEKWWLSDRRQQHEGWQQYCYSDEIRFRRGRPLGTAATMGGFTGDLSSTVALVDNSFFNNFQQSFTARSTLAFTVDLTTVIDAGSTPDAFSFYILDNTGTNIPTSVIAGSLLTANINATTTQFVGTGAYASISAVVTAGGAAVPEPSTLLLLGSAVWSALHRVKLF
jgi:PEP-CTERM motif